MPGWVSAARVVDARTGGAPLWTDAENAHSVCDRVARVPGLPQDKGPGIWPGFDPPAPPSTRTVPWLAM
jgi:hypothetical protein